MMSPTQSASIAMLGTTLAAITSVRLLTLLIAVWATTLTQEPAPVAMQDTRYRELNAYWVLVGLKQLTLGALFRAHQDVSPASPDIYLSMEFAQLLTPFANLTTPMDHVRHALLDLLSLELPVLLLIRLLTPGALLFKELLAYFVLQDGTSAVMEVVQ